MSPNYISRHDRTWRHDVVSGILGKKLTHDELDEALRICQDDFTQDDDFTASAFCQRLAEARPEVELGKQTRMLFLRGVRQHDTKPGPESDARTSPSTPQEPAAEQPPLTRFEHGIPERRRQSRKTTNLVGVYWHTHNKQQNGAMVVENLSLNGCGLHMLTPHDLKRGDTLRLEFKLDDASESFIRIHGQLRWVLYDLAGLEFQSPYGVPQVLAQYVES